MASGFHVDGLRETIKALEAAGVEVEDLKEAMGRIAAAAAEIIESNTPVGRTGKLRSSVRGNRAKGKAQVLAGRASVKYAAVVNYGWPKRHIKGRHFMQSADDRIGIKAVEMLEDNINEILKEKGLT